MLTIGNFKTNLGTLASSSVLLLAAGACSLAIDTSPKGVGLGETCGTDTDCHAGSCQDGVCVASCSVNADCPDPLKCLGNICQAPLKVRGLWVGVVSSGEGWTKTHQDGIDAIKADLPFMDFNYNETQLGANATKSMNDWITQEGVNVIIANSLSQSAEVDAMAKAHPEVKFMIAAGVPQAPNLSSYFGRMEQAWFVTGKIAAQQTRTKRLGYASSFITAETVRHLNAFTLGARSVDPSIVVEVRYAGFWYDYNVHPTFNFVGSNILNGKTLTLTAEEYVTAKLIDSGCDVIGHQMDNQRPVRFIEKYFKDGTLAKNGAPIVWSIGNDNQNSWRDSNGNALKSSIGSVYWNWGPLYKELISQIQHKQFQPISVNQAMSESPVGRIVSFDPNTDSDVGIDGEDVKNMLSTEARTGYQHVFAGPWDATNPAQHASQPKDQPITEDEWASMCWYVTGVVERTNPQDPKSADRPAIPPDYNNPAPTGEYPTAAPEVALAVPDAPRGVAWSCKDAPK